MTPILVVRLSLRGRGELKTPAFWIVVMFSVVLVTTAIWAHGWNEWLSDIEKIDEQLFFLSLTLIAGALILIPVQRYLVGKWLSARSRGFRLVVGALVVAVGVAVLGWYVWEEHRRDLRFYQMAEYTLVGLGIWLCGGVFWRMIRRKEVARRSAAAHLLGCCYLMTTMVMGLASKLFYEEEKYWVARNLMWEPDPEYPTKARRVMEVAYRKEISEILRSLPEMKEAP